MHSFKRSGALSGTAPSRAISLSFPFLPKASISFQGAFQKFPCVAKSCKKFPRFGTYQWVTGDLGRKKLPSWALPSGRVQHRPSADLLGRKIRRRSVYYSEQNQGIIQLLLFTRPPAPASRIERARPPSRLRPLRLDPRPAPFPFPSLSFQRLQFIWQNFPALESGASWASCGATSTALRPGNRQAGGRSAAARSRRARTSHCCRGRRRRYGRGGSGRRTRARRAAPSGRCRSGPPTEGRRAGSMPEPAVVVDVEEGPRLARLLIVGDQLGGRGTHVRCAASWLLAARAILQFCAPAAAGTARGRTWLPVTSDLAARLGAGPADGLLTTGAGTRSRSPDQERGSRSRLRRRLRAGGLDSGPLFRHQCFGCAESGRVPTARPWRPAHARRHRPARPGPAHRPHQTARSPPAPT